MALTLKSCGFCTALLDSVTKQHSKDNVYFSIVMQRYHTNLL